jgi:ATP-binding cassette subfamily G (WHITE) protein 2 (PDR)
MASNIYQMSMIFRTIAASTKTDSQAHAIAGVTVLAIVIYTGYIIPRPLMHPWFKWITYINPISYSFESLFINELHGQDFTCSNIVPAYPGLSGQTFICATPGAIAGQAFVSGDLYAESAYQYSFSHVWRNLGILIAFMLFFFTVYMFASEKNSMAGNRAEVLVFRRKHVPKQLLDAEKSSKVDDDFERMAYLNPSQSRTNTQEKEVELVKALAKQTDIFTWKDMCYDIKIKGKPRRLLDNVSGWVKPGTLTALMGVSGAGKTTLLDVLAQRVTMGVVTGSMLVSGKPLDPSFQRKTGYVQQQDLHLETSTVREALRFSAMLRQPKTVSKKEKYEFVEDVIKMLNMHDFAEAVVGVPGEGLNVEQRKLLTIGVELAAKPALLLFLDEPTSGLDSQSAWAIATFLRKLADNGQAVLATIHQPSAILFQEFDRLLFLANGGKTVYFGDIGKNSEILLDYFHRNGAPECKADDNPAEYMLTMVGAGPTGKTDRDWHEVWKASNEAREVQAELARIKREMSVRTPEHDERSMHTEFAMPFWEQFVYVTVRVFQQVCHSSGLEIPIYGEGEEMEERVLEQRLIFTQYWRTPLYMASKFFLGVVAALFIGFSFFHANSSEQGLQDVIFSIFMMTAILPTIVHQVCQPLRILIL